MEALLIHVGKRIHCDPFCGMPNFSTYENDLERERAILYTVLYSSILDLRCARWHTGSLSTLKQQQGLLYLRGLQQKKQLINASVPQLIHLLCNVMPFCRHCYKPPHPRGKAVGGQFLDVGLWTSKIHKEGGIQ